ncbi:MAG TPA: DUF6350 family protein [Actinomycetota bacterium]|jgi:hypothetical protein
MDEHRDSTEPSSSLARGWNTAILRAVLAAVVLLFLAQAVILLAYFAADDPSKPSARTVARYGGVVFYTFHHVGFRFDVPQSALSQGEVPFGVSAGGVVAIAAMAGTALGLWLLYLGGRAVAREGEGSTLARGLHGLKVAPPYAALTLLGSLLLRFKPEDGVQVPTIHPSYLAALLWPLALAAAAGFVGGVRSENSEGWARLIPGPEGSGRRLHGALAGGWRMILLGLVFAFVGLLVMAVVKPDSTADYFSTFDQGTLDGVLAIVATLLVLPNMAAWVLFPAMGSCVAVTGPLSICFLSYAHFPRDAGARIATTSNPAALSLPSAPVGYFLFLLVPVVAVLLGGMAAARKGRATTRNDAAVLGALAGVVFAVLSLLTIFLASITVRITGNIVAFAANGSFRIGPELTSGVLLALVWGVVGGALGGLWEGRSLPPRAVTMPAATAPASDRGDEPS